MTCFYRPFPCVKIILFFLPTLCRPVAGSKTDLRGRKAKSHICREILELCTVIHDVGTYNAKKRNDDDDDDDNEDDGTIIVSFGELFQVSGCSYKKFYFFFTFYYDINI